MRSGPTDQQLLQQCLGETGTSRHSPDYRGKVRDIYYLPRGLMAIVVTDRISAFDRVFREPVPFKGQLLNLLSRHAFKQVEDLCEHHLLDVPHPNVAIAKRCRPIPVEIVVRGYLTGHAWRIYQQGERILCGKRLPAGLNRNEPFPEPLVTPATKAAAGHDEDISRQQILAKGLLEPDQWNVIHEKALQLFARGSERAAERGLILADTKYEFGWYDDRIILIDEVHTTDSSRFFLASGYEDRLRRNEDQKQLSKEFLREWLIRKGLHQVMDRERIPELPDEVRISLYERYRELFELLTGSKFEPTSLNGFQLWLDKLLDEYGR